MSDAEIYTDGFDAFSDLLKEYEKQTDTKNILKVLETGAKEFVEDVRNLPRPRSRMTAPGYTHLLDEVTYQVSKDEVLTGWGKYYGPMVENGTIKMDGVAHMAPTFRKNKERYYKNMQKKIFG